MSAATTSEARSESQVWNSIQNIDLSMIKFKLMDSIEGESWTQQQADDYEGKYKKFLYLNFKYPDRPIIPSKAVDKFWHYHILDTRKYFDDCEAVFGFYLHHFPYFGMRGEQDAANLRSAFQESISLFEREFGVNAASSDDPTNPEPGTNPATCFLHDPAPDKSTPATCMHEPDRKKEDRPATCFRHEPAPGESEPATCFHAPEQSGS